MKSIYNLSRYIHVQLGVHFFWQIHTSCAFKVFKPGSKLNSVHEDPRGQPCILSLERMQSWPPEPSSQKTSSSTSNSYPSPTPFGRAPSSSTCGSPRTPWPHGVPSPFGRLTQIYPDCHAPGSQPNAPIIYQSKLLGNLN